MTDVQPIILHFTALRLTSNLKMSGGADKKVLSRSIFYQCAPCAVHYYSSWLRLEALQLDLENLGYK